MTQLEYQALILSLKISSTAILWLLPIAIFLAWILARKNFWGKAVLDSIIHLPLVLPPVVIGYLLLISFGQQAPIGKFLAQYFNLVFSFNWKGAVLASMIVSLPLMVRAIRLSLESIDPKLEQAAATLGASSYKIFFTISLPLTMPGIITGTMLAFARSLGEFGATISFVANIPNETQTIALAMFNFIETPNRELDAARLCAISIILALSSLIISEMLARYANRKLGLKI